MCAPQILLFSVTSPVNSLGFYIPHLPSYSFISDNKTVADKVWSGCHCWPGTTEEPPWHFRLLQERARSVRACVEEADDLQFCSFFQYGS